MQTYVSDPYEKYRQQGVMTASPMELIVMLYNGCIKQINLARINMEKKQADAANTALQKAQAIVNELSMSLDHSYEISEGLSDLYDFVMSELVAANVSKDAERLGPVIEILTELKDTWETVLKESKETRYAAMETSSL